MDVARTRDAPAGEDLSNGTAPRLPSERCRGSNMGTAGIAAKNARVISCSHKNGYTGLSSADRTVFSPMECLINQKLWFTGRPSSSCFLFQNNSVGPRFSRLPQKRRWRKSGLVDRRRNDSQKLNSICVSETSVFGEA